MEKVFHPDLCQCYQILSEYELQNKLIYKSKYYLRLSQKGIYESFQTLRHPLFIEQKLMEYEYSKFRKNYIVDNVLLILKMRKFSTEQQKKLFVYFLEENG
jgi:hypothetical protein